MSAEAMTPEELALVPAARADPQAQALIGWLRAQTRHASDPGQSLPIEDAAYVVAHRLIERQGIFDATAILREWVVVANYVHAHERSSTTTVFAAVHVYHVRPRSQFSGLARSQDPRMYGTATGQL